MRNWTDEQIKAIESKPNIIVSAAAGSGKTAVLVERIIRKLIPDESGNFIPAENLLVVTFARDAAHEMQDRIKKSIKEAYESEKNPSKRAVLKAQMKKIPYADITTIDSFCMHMVKENFHLLGIDSKFSIIDSAEAVIYTYECIEEYFDMLYEKQDREFLELTDLYSSGFDDRELIEAVYDTYVFTRSLPYPEEWMTEHSEDYSSFSGGLFHNMVIAELKKASENVISDLYSLIDRYEKNVSDFGAADAHSFGEYDLVCAIENDIELIKKMDSDWDKVYELKNEFPQLKKSRSKKEEFVIHSTAAKERDGILKSFHSVSGLITAELEDMDKKYDKTLYPHAKAFAKLLNGFSEFFYNRKNNDKKFEFNDLEHMTKKLIRNCPEIRDSLRDKYKEILMDEYQDTNGLQEEIFSLISTGDNRFIVGDIKQSIYGFRQSDPTIFADKTVEYSSGTGNGECVVLSNNFRSRSEVLTAVNYFFERTMSKKLGGVVYDENHKLNYGNKSFDTADENSSYTAELHIIEGEYITNDEEENADDETMGNIERESAYVAELINRMIEEEFKVLDGGELRPVRADDFAILMNSVKKGKSEAFSKALMKYNISSHSEDDGFFQKTEIRLITEFVKAVNNPVRDIPLVSVMRSPIYRFTDDELAIIRLCTKGVFWKAVVKYSKESDLLAQKCRRFMVDINRWRKMSGYMSADRLIWRILTESSLYDMCGILYGGDAALANLRLFMERARILSEDGIATLYDFEQYINRISESDGLKCAPVSGNGVTIMTIHKSKGLEFPVTFICGVGKKFFNNDGKKKILLHKDTGFGIRDYDKKLSCFYNPINRHYIAKMRNTEAISEQMRKLYVGVTRAKEKLIITGVVDNITDKKTSENKTFEFTDRNLTEDDMLKCNSFAKLLAPIIKKCNTGEWKYFQVPFERKETEEVTDVESVQAEEIPEGVKEGIFGLLDKYGSIKQVPAVPSKVTVSQLKGNIGYSAKLQRMPAFMGASEMKGASFGTAVHEVMEKICIKDEMSPEYIRSETERICPDGGDVVFERVLGFFESELGRRTKASVVKREMPFETEIPAIDVNGNEVKGETMLLQGVIDLYFEDGDKLVLVDYKTDKCTDADELAEKYKIQLKWYKFAMEKLLRKKVREVYIYSFHLGEAIEISGRLI